MIYMTKEQAKIVKDQVEKKLTREDKMADAVSVVVAPFVFLVAVPIGLLMWAGFLLLSEDDKYELFKKRW
jgi:hypothetical protein